jgi:hypothetical protein
VVRHRLTPELTQAGGHVGYHVAAPWRRQGHATPMLAAGEDRFWIRLGEGDPGTPPPARTSRGRL